MMYNPIYGRTSPPTKEEIECHNNSWWVQGGHDHGYYSWHLHNVSTALEFLKATSKAEKPDLIWRPYYKETGILCAS
jgi:hypothetical protein